jgi:hypothetical protein
VELELVREEAVARSPSSQLAHLRAKGETSLAGRCGSRAISLSIVAEQLVGAVNQAHSGEWDPGCQGESGCQGGAIGTLTRGTIRRYHAHQCALRHRAPVRVPSQSNWHPDSDGGQPGTIASGWGRWLPRPWMSSWLAADSCTVIY